METPVNYTKLLANFSESTVYINTHATNNTEHLVNYTEPHAYANEHPINNIHLPAKIKHNYADATGSLEKSTEPSANDNKSLTSTTDHYSDRKEPCTNTAKPPASA